MGEDASWSLELVDSWAGSHDALERGDNWEESWPLDSWTAQRDGRRCLLEPGAGRQLGGKSRRAGKGRQLGRVMAVHARGKGVGICTVCCKSNSLKHCFIKSF